MKTYNDERLLNRDENPLLFWKSRENVYPGLSKFAKQYLAMPATSVPSERVFSKAGELISDRRNRLSAEHVNELLFINANTQLFE